MSFGVIRNASLRITEGNTTTVNGTCATCLCALAADSSLFSFNCFTADLTCEMHSKSDQDNAFTLVDSSMSNYYFISLPTYQGIISPESTSISMGE